MRDDDPDFWYSVTWRVPGQEHPHILDFDADEPSARAMAIGTAINLAEGGRCDVVVHEHTLPTMDPDVLALKLDRQARMERLYARAQAGGLDETQ